MNQPGDRGDDWIPQEEYERIQARVPILCVDLLPLQPSTGAVGLIRRETYGGNEGWCLIGGAVKRNEDLLAAIARHVDSTLGGDVEHELSSDEPLVVAQYFTEARAGRLHDPRKHAVALSYTGTLHGDPQPQGEAIEFRWFGPDELDTVHFGFGQGDVVGELLNRLATASG